MWRLSAPAFVALIATVVLLSVVSAAMWLAGMRSRVAAAIAWISGAAGMLATPAGLHVLARRWPTQPPSLFLWTPTIAVLILLVALRALFPASTSRKLMLKYRLAFVGLLLALVTLNLANWCNPGWCGQFGFPFLYEWWSDAVVIFDGKNLSAGISVMAALADVGVALAACWLLVRAFRRASALVVR